MDSVKNAKLFTLLAILAVFQLTTGDVTSTGWRRLRRSLRQHKLPPIVLIPGNSGSQIEAKVERPAGSSGIPGCADSRDWFRAWMNVYEMFPENVPCWSSFLTLQFNNETKRCSSVPGVETRIPGFGHTETIEFVDPSWTAWSLGNVGAYLNSCVQQLVSWGYERGTSLRGAPYDFRYAPHSLTSYYARLKTLIEETFAANGRRRVVLLAHSQGGLVSLYFLMQQDQQWKDIYIHSLVAVGSPWAGSAIIVNIFASGYTMGVSAYSSLLIREQQRSFESAPMMLPRAPAWSDDETLLMAPHRNYTLNDYDDLFDDLGFPQGHEMLTRVQQEDYAWRHPGVDMYCWHGSGIPTQDRIEYGDGFPNVVTSRVHHVDGDRVVSRKSLRACQHFMNDRNYVNSLREFRRAEHNDIFTDPIFLNQFRRLLKGRHSDQKANVSAAEPSDGRGQKRRFFNFLW